MAENTALLVSLFPKLQVEPAVTPIDTLGLTRYVDRMHEGNEQFKQAEGKYLISGTLEGMKAWRCV